jgi:hypothetical protein
LYKIRETTGEKIVVFWGARGGKYILYEMEQAFGFGKIGLSAEGGNGERWWMKSNCSDIFVRSHEKVPEKSDGKVLRVLRMSQ